MIQYVGPITPKSDIPVVTNKTEHQLVFPPEALCDGITFAVCADGNVCVMLLKGTDIYGISFLETKVFKSLYSEFVREGLSR